MKFPSVLEPRESERSDVRDLVVVAKERVAAEVVSIRLRRVDGGRLPDWTPGAHIDVILPNGITRQYSLCGDPATVSNTGSQCCASRWGAAAPASSMTFSPSETGSVSEVHETTSVSSRPSRTRSSPVASGSHRCFPWCTRPRRSALAGGSSTSGATSAPWHWRMR